jgi:hypothetical protein
MYGIMAEVTQHALRQAASAQHLPGQHKQWLTSTVTQPGHLQASLSLHL